MKSKKFICAVAAAVMMTTMAFASCGNSSSSTGTSSKAADSASSVESTTAVETSETKEKNIDSLSEKLKDCFSDAEKQTLTTFDAQRIDRMIGVKEDLYAKAVCLVDASGGSANEIDCFEAKDEATAKDIETALKKRVEDQKTAFKDYVPAEMPKLESAVIVADGKYVFLCVSSDSDKAKSILG